MSEPSADALVLRLVNVTKEYAGGVAALQRLAAGLDHGGGGKALDRAHAALRGTRGEIAQVTS